MDKSNEIRETMLGSTRLRGVVFFLAFILCGMVSPFSAVSADVVVVGDTSLKPVTDIIAGIKETLSTPLKVYSLSDVRGRLNGIVEREGATTVIALGKEAISDALQLPSSVAVIYDMVVVPPRTSRPNTTGLYMATPVAEYLSVIRKYLPSIRRVSVVTSQDMLRTLGASAGNQVAAYYVKSSIELISTVNKLDEADALLLLPDVPLLTASAMDEIYLFSFRKRIPVLGLSERHVRQGALFALTFDPVSVGRQIGERASESLNGTDVGQFPPAASRKFDLFINSDTARKMGIAIPDEMFKRAKKVYP